MPDRALTEKVKVGLAVASIAAILISVAIARLKARAKDNSAASEFLNNTPVMKFGRYTFNASQTFLAALFLLGIFTTINYTAYGDHQKFKKYDSYDLLHYYITPKYFDELGYFNLLPALIAADAEQGRYCASKTRKYLYQNEHDYEIQPIGHALARADEIKALFTPERWEQFVYDVIYLQRKAGNMDCGLWRMLLQDHGFNGTPVWVLIARPVTRLVPVEIVKYAAYLDVIWIVAALLSVGWAFGPRTALFSWIFIGICYSFRWPILSFALLRYDWIASMVIGLCMLKKKRYVTSGAFFGYATLMRYFPGLWLFGIAAKGVHALFTRTDIPLPRIWQRVPGHYYRMAMGFFGIVIVLVSLSLIRDGYRAHEASLKNLAAHVQPHNLSSRRMGLVIALVYRGETEQKLITNEKKEMVAAIETKVRVASILGMLLLGLFMTRLRDWEAVGYGFMPYFWLTTSSYYYYAILLTGVIIHCKDLTRVRNAVGLILLFFIQLFFNASEHLNPGNRYFTISVACVLLTIYSAIMMGFLGHNWWKTRKETTA